MDRIASILLASRQSHKSGDGNPGTPRAWAARILCRGYEEGSKSSIRFKRQTRMLANRCMRMVPFLPDAHVLSPRSAPTGFGRIRKVGLENKTKDMSGSVYNYLPNRQRPGGWHWRGGQACLPALGDRQTGFWIAAGPMKAARVPTCPDRSAGYQTPKIPGGLQVLSTCDGHYYYHYRLDPFSCL